MGGGGGVEAGLPGAGSCVLLLQDSLVREGGWQPSPQRFPWTACPNKPFRRHDDAHESLSPARLERIFLYCLAWGLGGLLDVRDRAALDAELRSFGANMPPRWGAALGGFGLRCALVRVCACCCRRTQQAADTQNQSTPKPAGSRRATQSSSGASMTPPASGATGAAPCPSGTTPPARSAPSLRSW